MTGIKVDMIDAVSECVAQRFIALVRRAKLSQVRGEVRYAKTAAAMADAGEVRDIVEGIWKNEDRGIAQNLMEKVRSQLTMISFAHPI